MPLLSRVVLPLLLLIYISVETYLKLQHSSLCGAVGCKLAGEILNFKAIYLNYFGIIGIFSLIVLGLLSLKRKWAEVLFFMGLYCAIAFESTIISYQFIANSEPCLFCLGIISSLLFIALLAQYKKFIFVVPAVLAIFIGLNTLAISKNKAFMTKEATYLINSKTCPHCKKVKVYLQEHNISYIPISTKEASARNFLKFANITSIPVLIIKTKEETSMRVGDKRIINYYDTQRKKNAIEKQPEESTQTISEIDAGLTTNSNDFLSQGNEEGCAITITEIPDCEKESGVLPFKVIP